MGNSLTDLAAAAAQLFETSPLRLRGNEERKFSRSIRQLDRIAAQGDGQYDIDAVQGRAEEALDLFMRYVEEPVGVLQRRFSRRTVVHLVAALHLEDKRFGTRRKLLFMRYLPHCLAVANYHASPRLLGPSLFVLIQNWRSLLRTNQQAFDLLTAFIKRLVEANQQTSSRVTRLLDSLPFIVHAEGPARLVNSRQVTIANFQTDLDTLRLTSRIAGSTYRDALLLALAEHWVKKQTSELIPLLKLCTTQMGTSRTGKLLLISTLATKHLPTDARRTLLNYVQLEIGEPSNPEKFSDHTLARDEQRQVDAARKLLQRWLNYDLIRAIMVNIFDNQDREDFWLKYSGSIGKIELVGNPRQRRGLSNYLTEESIEAGDFLKDNWILIHSTVPDCALLLHIDDSVFIEFNSNGALQVWPAKNFYKKTEVRYINSLYRLRNASLARIQRPQEFYMRVGKLWHTRNWEDFVGQYLAHWQIHPDED